MVKKKLRKLRKILRKVDKGGKNKNGANRLESD